MRSSGCVICGLALTVACGSYVGPAIARFVAGWASPRGKRQVAGKVKPDEAQYRAAALKQHEA